MAVSQEMMEPVGGKTDLKAITVYLKPNAKQRLEKWAAKRDRSVSWLVSRLVDEALEANRDNEEPEEKL